MPCRMRALCDVQSKSLSYFTPQKLATAAENFQMEHDWKDEFEVTEGHENTDTHLHWQMFYLCIRFMRVHYELYVCKTKGET